MNNFPYQDYDLSMGIENQFELKMDGCPEKPPIRKLVMVNSGEGEGALKSFSNNMIEGLEVLVLNNNSIHNFLNNYLPDLNTL